MKKKINWQKAISLFVFISLLLSMVYTAVMIVITPNDAVPGHGQRVRTDYILMFFQCFLGIIAMWLPSFLYKKVKLVIPSNMIILYILFLYCAIYLGEVRSFYYNVKHWDTILHTFSGAMIGALGFSVISFLNKTERVPLDLSPAFVAFFAFCFSLTMGVIWEFYEYTLDGLMGLNMQKTVLANGVALVGHNALKDTMKDLLVDGVGAFVMSVIGYISLKWKKGWIERLRLYFSK